MGRNSKGAKKNKGKGKKRSSTDSKTAAAASTAAATVATSPNGKDNSALPPVVPGRDEKSAPGKADAPAAANGVATSESDGSVISAEDTASAGDEAEHVAETVSAGDSVAVDAIDEMEASAAAATSDAESTANAVAEEALAKADSVTASAIKEAARVEEHATVIAQSIGEEVDEAIAAGTKVAEDKIAEVEETAPKKEVGDKPMSESAAAAAASDAESTANAVAEKALSKAESMTEAAMEESSRIQEDAAATTRSIGSDSTSAVDEMQASAAAAVSDAESTANAVAEEALAKEYGAAAKISESIVDSGATDAQSTANAVAEEALASQEATATVAATSLPAITGAAAGSDGGSNDTFSNIMGSVHQAVTGAEHAAAGSVSTAEGTLDNATVVMGTVTSQVDSALEIAGAKLPGGEGLLGSSGSGDSAVVPSPAADGASAPTNASVEVSPAGATNGGGMEGFLSGALSSVQGAVKTGEGAAVTTLTAADGALGNVKTTVVAIQTKVDSTLADFGGGKGSGVTVEPLAAPSSTAGKDEDKLSGAIDLSAVEGTADGDADASRSLDITAGKEPAKGLIAEVSDAEASFLEAVKKDPYAQDPADKKMLGTCKVPGRDGCVIS